MKSKVVKISNSTRAVHTDVGVYAVSLNPTGSDWQNVFTSDTKIDWEANSQNVLDKKIVPFGANNNLPVLIRNIMDDNNLAPGILERERGLLYGDGPQLYRVVYENGEVTRKYDYDKEIWDWLKSWDLRRFLNMAMVEYKYMNGIFVRRYRNRGVRVGEKAIIAKLEVVPNTDARLEWPEEGNRLEFVKNIFTGDFENNCQKTGITTFPIYEPLMPFKHPVSMSYHNTYSFARTFYSVPSYYGTLKWIMRSSDIPEIIDYLTKNGIATAFHVHSPVGYWEAKKEKLEKIYPNQDDVFIEKKLEELKDLTFKNMTEVLAGKKNAGKFIETVDFYDDDRNLCSWKIEPIDQKIKSFIEAQIKISEKADSATTSGLGLHPSLSNIIIGGQLSSGSQMLYAMKLYLASDTTIPEEVIFEAVNQAIAANFPSKDLKIGFYHKVVKAEAEVAPKERTKNKI